MIIKIDSRENDLLQKIKFLVNTIPIFNSIIIQEVVLPLGDVIICNENEEKIIIERKTVNDLLSSIKDGRYEEQSFRLNGIQHHNHNIIYLIEGEVGNVNRFKLDNRIEKLTLYSSMFSLNYYKGFSVFRSISLEESATIICNMAYKLEKELTSDKKAYYTNNFIVEKDESDEIEETKNCEKEYVGVVKKVKKDNITPDNIGPIMLSQIPGVSSITANAIFEKYKTISDLIKEIELNNNCLKDLSTINNKGQSRKISKASIANIVKFLLKK